MNLHGGLYGWLVGNGHPLDALYWERLPEEQIGDVDVCVFTTPGIGAETVLGKQELVDPEDGITDDGGVDDIHTGLTFEAREREGDDYIGLGRETLNKVMGRTLRLDADNRPQVGVLTAGQNTPVPGYTFTGYAGEQAATDRTGNITGTLSEEIGGIYTATVKTTTLEPLRLIEQGKSYYAMPNDGSGKAPSTVSIDGKWYPVSQPINTRFFEIEEFDGFQNGRDYRVQVIFVDGSRWVESGDPAFPFLLCELTNAPFVIEQDRRERLITQLTLELWYDPYEGRRVA